MEFSKARSSTTGDAVTASLENLDLGFLPPDLTGQCRVLIHSYHDAHGFTCLPDILWKARLQPLIEQSLTLNQLLRQASTTRSAKKANNGFVQIAAAILALEILASSFSGWSAIHPDAAAAARATLSRNGQGMRTPLMDFYLYPPKYLSPAAIAALLPPVGHGNHVRPQPATTRLASSSPEPSFDHHARQTAHRRVGGAAASPT